MKNLAAVPHAFIPHYEMTFSRCEIARTKSAHLRESDLRDEGRRPRCLVISGSARLRAAKALTLCRKTRKVVHPHFDVSPTPFVGDAGDLALPNTSLAGMREAMAAHVAAQIAWTYLAGRPKPLRYTNLP